MGKKYRKIAKAKIHLKKKYFIGKESSINKWIHLELFTTSFEAMGHETLILTAMNNMGKIYMNASLKNTNDWWNNVSEKIQVNETTDLHNAYNKAMKEDLKLLGDVKEKAMQNKTEKFKSIVEGNNEFLRNMKNQKHNSENIYEDFLLFRRLYLMIYQISHPHFLICL